MNSRETTTIVGLGEIAVASDPAVDLVCLGLGSCVAVSAYDPVSKVAGLAHIVLPESNGRADKTSAKYADTGIPALFHKMQRAGASRSRLIVKIAGGARMSMAPGLDGFFNIGERNIKATESILAENGIRVVASDKEGNRGRTVRMSAETGQVLVTAIGRDGKAL